MSKSAIYQKFVEIFLCPTKKFPLKYLQIALRAMFRKAKICV